MVNAKITDEQGTFNISVSVTVAQELHRRGLLYLYEHVDDWRTGVYHLSKLYDWGDRNPYMVLGETMFDVLRELGEERTFTETQVRRLLYVIGMHIPLNALGSCYDRLNDVITAGHTKSIEDLMKIARGTWCDAGPYAVGSKDDPNCDLPRGPLWERRDEQ